MIRIGLRLTMRGNYPLSYIFYHVVTSTFSSVKDSKSNKEADGLSCFKASFITATTPSSTASYYGNKTLIKNYQGFSSAPYAMISSMLTVSYLRKPARHARKSSMVTAS